MTKKTLILLLIFFCAIIALLIGSQIDDDLSEDALSLIKKVDYSGHSESYYYLMGIYASEKENAKDIGKNIVNQYNKKSLDSNYNIVEYPEAKKIPLPKNNIFCRTWEGTCLYDMFNEPFDINILLKDNHTLLSRMSIIHGSNDYKTLTKPSIDELPPSFEYFSAAEQIKLLLAISKHKEGKTQQAIELLEQQFFELRRLLKRQDTLIGKLILLTQLSEVIDVYSIILSNTNFTANFIPLLSESERSLEKAFVREFFMQYEMFKNLDKNPELFEIDGKLPGFIARLLYKPNMTINTMTPRFSRLLKIESLSPRAFAAIVSLDKEPTHSSKLRNFVGSVLVRVAYPDFDQYIASFIDFNAKLSLFNHRYHYQKDIDTIENPYYMNKHPVVSKNQICFEGPFESYDYLRCLVHSI